MRSVYSAIEILEGIESSVGIAVTNLSEDLDWFMDAFVDQMTEKDIPPVYLHTVAELEENAEDPSIIILESVLEDKGFGRIVAIQVAQDDDGEGNQLVEWKTLVRSFDRQAGYITAITGDKRHLEPITAAEFRRYAKLLQEAAWHYGFQLS